MDCHLFKLMCYLFMELFWFCGKEEKYTYIYTYMYKKHTFFLQIALKIKSRIQSMNSCF